MSGFDGEGEADIVIQAGVRRTAEVEPAASDEVVTARASAEAGAGDDAADGAGDAVDADVHADADAVPFERGRMLTIAAAVCVLVGFALYWIVTHS